LPFNVRFRNANTPAPTLKEELESVEVRGYFHHCRGLKISIVPHGPQSGIEDDRELFGAGISEDWIIWLKFSEDGRFAAAFVNQGAGDDHRSRVYFLDRSTRNRFQPLITDVPANFDGAFGGHTLFLRTTWNAPNRRVLAVDLANPARENWRQVIPQVSDSVITDIAPAGHKLLAFFSRNVNTQLVLLAPDGAKVRDIALPTLGSCYSMRETTWDSDEIFYEFESFAHPWTIYRYNLTTGQQSTWDKLNLPIDSDAIATTQVWYTSKDGTRVPMFVVARKGTEWVRNRPTILYAYGSSGAIMTPGFDEKVAMWVADGGIYALANIRGGGEFGEKWHRDGMLGKKQNSFDDFIAAAEWLIANNYKRPAKLGIRGSSSGGLLVATVTTQRPDLFRAVICDAPLLDMLRSDVWPLCRGLDEGDRQSGNTRGDRISPKVLTVPQRARWRALSRHAVHDR
jgi:prolyl oligopeptidase